MSLALADITLDVGAERWLERISLELEPGPPTVLLGPTLAGKTSLLRVMAGLDRPTRGRIWAKGADVTGRSVRERRVAMVYQQFINYPSFTVYRNIAAPLLLARLPRAEVDARVKAMAEKLGLGGLLERLPSELSGGQQQRTAIARALVRESELLLLDEPLVNLDYKLREELRSEMKSLFREREGVVVYATTEPLEALSMGGRVVVLDEGRVLQSGPALEVFRRPVSLAVARHTSDPPMNIGPARVEQGTLRLGDIAPVALPPHLRSLPEGPCTVGIRAERLHLAPPGGESVRVPARVELAEVNGSETFVHVRHDPFAWIVRAPGIHRVELEAPLEIHLRPGDLYAFDRGGALLAAPPHGQGG